MFHTKGLNLSYNFNIEANEDHYWVLSDFDPVGSVQLPVLENHHEVSGRQN